MLAVTGRSITELYREITEQVGTLIYREADFRMSPARKEELRHILFEEARVPALANVARVDRSDGVKLWFSDGSWVICRFSGTEPLLRMAAEAETAADADGYIRTWQVFLSL